MTTFSVLTTPANELMSVIHNSNLRMPLILSPIQEERWLQADLTKDDIKNFFQPYSSIEMQAHPIHKEFLQMDPHNPELIKATQNESR